MNGRDAVIRDDAEAAIWYRRAWLAGYLASEAVFHVRRPPPRAGTASYIGRWPSSRGVLDTVTQT